MLADRNDNEEIKLSAREITKEMKTYVINEYYGKRIVQYFTTRSNLYRYQKPNVVLHDGDQIEILSPKLKIIWPPGHALGKFIIYFTL